MVEEKNRPSLLERRDKKPMELSKKRKSDDSLADSEDPLVVSADLVSIGCVELSDKAQPEEGRRMMNSIRFSTVLNSDMTGSDDAEPMYRG